MRTWKFQHRLLALLLAALMLCAYAPADVLHQSSHAHAELVKSPDAGEVPVPCEHTYVDGVCSKCGEACTHANSHAETEDQTICLRICDDCGMTVSRIKHFADCSAPSNCLYCGRTDCVDPSINHSLDADKVCVNCGNPCPHTNLWFSIINENTHWSMCGNCYESFDTTPHTFKNGVCTVCLFECPSHTFNESGLCNMCGCKCLHNSYHTDYDEDTHWAICDDCNMILEGKIWPEHEVYCDTPGVCAECGASITTGYVTHVDVDYETLGYDENQHWYVCNACGGKEALGNHYAFCEAPGVCALCNAPYTGKKIEHIDIDWRTYEYDDKQHWLVCNTCGEECYHDEHGAICDKPGVCVVCGSPYTGEQIMHTHDEKLEYNDEQHWDNCLRCGEKLVENHYSYCTAIPGWCDCGAPTSTIIHEVNLDKLVVTHETHQYTCTLCYKTITEKHSLDSNGECVYGCKIPDHNWKLESTKDATCTADGWENYVCTCGETKQESITAKGHTPGAEATCTTAQTCTVCSAELAPAKGHTPGAEATCTTAQTCTVCSAELTPAKGHTPGAEATCTTAQTCTVCSAELAPAGNHVNWNEVVAPTCTEDGYTRYTCYLCGDSYRLYIVPAKGHAYGEQYVSLGNATHATSCLNGCGEQKTVDCIMNAITVGQVNYSMCSVCGYTQNNHADVAALTVVTTLVENAAYELEQPAAGPDLTLVVHEQVVMDAATADNAKLQVALRMFDLTLVDANGQEQKLTGKARISIPCEDLDLTNLRLVLVQEDGTLLEIEYEIKDGKMVFETEKLGIFALLPREA